MISSQIKANLEVTPHHREFCAATFLATLDQSPPLIRDIIVNEDVKRVHHTMAAGSLEIKNSFFENFLVPSYSYPIFRLYRCKISTLEFYDCQINALSIEDCVIEKVSIDKKCIFNQSVKFKNCQIGLFQIHEGGNKINTVEFDGDCIDTIQANDRVSSLGLKDVINDQSHKQTSLMVSTSLGEININNSKLQQFHCEGQQNSISIRESSVTEDMLFNFRVIHMTVIDSTFKNMTLSLGCEHFYLYGSYFESLSIRERNSHFEVDRGKQAPHKDTTIKELDLCNSRYSHVLLNSLQLEKLLLNDFHSETMSMRFVVVREEIRVEHSTMEGAELHNVNLSNCQIRLINSSMEKSKIINVEWPSGLYEYDSELKSKSLREKLNILWPLKEAYRQLKVLSLEQHNQVDALSFQKHELKIYWKIVHRKLWSKDFFRWQDIGKWFILGSNRIFSDFGQSWALPLVWLIVLHSGFFYLLLENYDLGLKLSPAPSALSTGKGFAMFINLISPVHNTEIIHPFSKEKVSIFGTIDFFMRVASAYFIYYFLKATRKFSIST